MALYDDKFWLLSHIRHSFISSDDTGMCELVMAGETKDLKQHIGSMEPYPEPEDSEDEEDDFGSSDYHTDVDFGIRERINTLTQLEKLERKVSRTSHIKWELNKDVKQEDVEEMFERKEVNKTATNSKKPKSLLSELIKKSANMPKNPYIQYAKFDGSGQANSSIKQYKIFLTMLPPQQRNYPVHISCISTARIQELIGVILLKLSVHTTGFNFLPVTQYGLYITEEDGEVDRDFPCLDPREPISKFGFTCLGLVEHREHAKTVSFPDETIYVFPVEDTQRMKTLSDKSKAEETRQMENNIQAIENHNKVMEAPLYKSFRAFIISKVKRKVEVNIGISGERIEIDPVTQKTPKLMPFKQKAVSHHMDCITSCEIIERKSTKTCFKLSYVVNDGSSSVQSEIGNSGATSYFPASQASSNFKSYEFEADNSTAQEIVSKIKLILELRNNTSRDELKVNKDKKFVKRISFNLVK